MKRLIIVGAIGLFPACLQFGRNRRPNHDPAGGRDHGRGDHVYHDNVDDFAADEHHDYDD